MADRLSPIGRQPAAPAPVATLVTERQGVSRLEHPLRAVRRLSLSEEVADRLREGIVTGAFRPGQHLREGEISAALDVSRSPVRDAFAQLHHEGLVTVRLHRGAVVVGMSIQDVEDVYSLRLSLETLAVGMAAKRALPAELVALRHGASSPRDHPSAELGQRRFAELDIAFHDMIYRAAHHERLYACWQMLRPNIFRFLLTRNIANADYKELFVREHLELAEIVAAGDGDGAQRMAASHLEGAYTRLLREIEDDYKEAPPESDPMQ